MVYVPGSCRHLLLIAQFLLFFLITVYSLFISIRSEGKDRVHYRAICVSGAVMTLFIAVQMTDPFAPFYTIGCLIANCLLHVFVEEDEKRDQRREKERYSQIFAGLAEDYEAIYYIDIETGQFLEVSVSSAYERMNVPKKGEDFYRETRENAERFVYPKDRAFAVSMYDKETMLKNLQDRKSYSYKYRVMTPNGVRTYRFAVMRSDDGEHFVLCVKDIQDTITAETAFMEKHKISVTFGQIAESLASNYDVIYYVDANTGEYVGYTSNNIYGELKVDESGDDFFERARMNASVVIHPWDRERIYAALDRDNLISALDGKKQFEIQYRMIVDNRVQHTRFFARKSSDGAHLIIGVENIDEEVMRETEHLRALNTEKELARRDELTGIRNKTAFTELEQSVQDNLEKGMDYLPFAIAVCDLNDLKKINDSEGHKAGDEYIRTSAKLLCDIFEHSPVFRIGGDEFAIFLRGEDFSSRQELLEKLHRTVQSNLDRHEGPITAVGVADYDPANDTSVTEIFDRADHLMYEDKRTLKASS